MSSVLTDFTMVLRVCCLFFFFQAEDGIRDDLVTGVQTCALPIDRKSTRLNSSHQIISYAVFCLKKKKEQGRRQVDRQQRAPNGDSGQLRPAPHGAPPARAAREATLCVAS